MTATKSEAFCATEKMQKKPKLPYGEYMERVVKRKKKSSPRKEREQFVPIED